MTSQSEEPKRTISPELDPYPAFLLHLKEITAWLRSGCSVKSVWRAYARRGAFPGSYRSFLRYCRKHDLGYAEQQPEPPSSGGPTQSASPSPVMPQPKRYPPPRTKPPGIVPDMEDLEL
jgi:hypothetical protein